MSSRRRPGPITTTVCDAKAPTPNLRKTAPCGYGSRPSPGRRGILRRRIHLSASTPEIALTQVNIEPGADDDGGAGDGGDFRHVAEHDEAEDHRPDDHRILIGHDDAGRRELERAVDAEQR